MSNRQIWILLVFFLIYIVTTILTDLHTVDETWLGHQLEGGEDCLGRCKQNTSKFRASKSQDDIDCYKQCLARKRTKRDTDDALIYQSCKPTPTQLRQQEIGNITNISVEFTKRQENGTTVAYLADLTWDVQYLNSSSYNADIWQGFTVQWIKGKGNNNPMQCAFNNKNTTRIRILINPNEADPLPLHIMIIFYPPSKESFLGYKMPSFYPEGWFTTIHHSTSTSSSKTSVLLPTSTSYIDPRRHQPTEQPKPVNDVVGAVIAGLSVGCILAIVLFVYLRRRRKKTNTFKPDPPDTEYDTSIIYSSKDQNFVIKKLIPFLEEKNSFKCFVHYRNWEPGKSLDDNMVHSVYKCRKVIAVISKHFFASNYCQRELSMALERLARCNDSSLIVINLGVPLNDLPEAIRIRTFLDLTCSKEKKYWRTRLEKQISVEESSGNTSSKSRSKTICSEIIDDSEMSSWATRLARQISEDDLGNTSLDSKNDDDFSETTEDATEINSLRNAFERQDSNTVVTAKLRTAYSRINGGRESSDSESSIGTGSPV